MEFLIILLRCYLGSSLQSFFEPKKHLQKKQKKDFSSYSSANAITNKSINTSKKTNPKPRVSNPDGDAPIKTKKVSIKKQNILTKPDKPEGD